jgi:hypothetical protein
MFRHQDSRLGWRYLSLPGFGPGLRVSRRRVGLPYKAVERKRFGVTSHTGFLIARMILHSAKKRERGRSWDIWLQNKLAL